MRIFVTVGTTAFDPLVRVVDAGPHANRATLQIADGEYVPLQSEWCRFTSDIGSAFLAADVIVCHAGAGTVFSLLEAGVVPIVVANLVRRDKHQTELSDWLARRRYAVVSESVNSVNACIERYAELSSQCVPFTTPRFFYADEMNSALRAAMTR